MAILSNMAAEEGYAQVSLMYAAGAFCCIDYQYADHAQCPWHYADREAELIAAYATNVRANEGYEGLECARCGEWLPAYAKGGGQITRASGFNFCEECTYPDETIHPSDRAR